MAHLAAHFEPAQTRHAASNASPSPQPYTIGHDARSSASATPSSQAQHTFPQQLSDSGQLVRAANPNGLPNHLTDTDSQQLAPELDDEDDASTASGRRHGALLVEEVNEWMLQHSFFHWGLKRHITHGNPKPRDERDLPDWRMRERLRTVTAALVMCLNIGVDPPDVSKTNPCSKLICWMDPSSLEVSKALPAIGRNLQAQFETLSTKTRYKQYLDPIVEETRRFCTNLRRAAKDERVLFYYNGYGVPKPTPGGEIWVFNKAYTQYIPVTLYDLLTWLGSPCIFVWDASSAGNVVVNFKRLQERKAEEDAARANRGDREGRDRDRASGTTSASSSAKKTADQANNEEPHFPLRESIHLAACGPDEVLPMNPDLPADLFTCCLTSPIEISLRWFVLQNPLPSKLNVDMVMNIPGRLQDRRTPLGELNWIFTAITDTIAWTVLPRTIFRRLFRDDLMVAALLRNFLLAERIMRFYHCTPMSHPKLPPTHNHPLWDSWDLAVDQCLAQLPTLLAKERAQQRRPKAGHPSPRTSRRSSTATAPSSASSSRPLRSGFSRAASAGRVGGVESMPPSRPTAIHQLAYHPPLRARIRTRLTMMETQAPCASRPTSSRSFYRCCSRKHTVCARSSCSVSSSTWALGLLTWRSASASSPTCSSSSRAPLPISSPC